MSRTVGLGVTAAKSSDGLHQQFLKVGSVLTADRYSRELLGLSVESGFMNLPGQEPPSR